jgi:hypothetical protein
VSDGPGYDRAARLTWDGSGPAPFESIWSLIIKIQALNVLGFAELRKLGIFGSEGTAVGHCFVSHRDWDIQRLASHLQVDASRIRSAFPDCIGLPTFPPRRYDVRQCPKCCELGYHCTLFNIACVSRCPWHDRPLKSGCTRCARLALGWSWRSETVDARWRCPECGYVVDCTRDGRANRLASTLEEEIHLHCERLLTWWATVVRVAGDASDLVMPLAYAGSSEVISRGAWRLGWATSLSRPPDGWGIGIPLLRVHSSLRVSLKETEVARSRSLRADEYRSVKRTIFERFVREHSQCLSELMEMGPFERTALDSGTLCTSCLAYLCWRATHEGRLPFRDQIADVHPKVRLRRAIFAGVYPAERTAELLLYANFIRIWSDIEEVTAVSALRIMLAGSDPEPLDLPRSIVDVERGKEAICLLPSARTLAIRASHRCEQRRLAGIPMSWSAAAYANSGWNAVADERLLFSARNHQPHFRNTYSYIYV